MFGSQALETAIGLVLLFFVLAVAVSSVTELISQGLQKRARDLEKTIARMLSASQSDPTGSPVSRFWGGVRRLVRRPASTPSGLPEEIDRRLRVGVARGAKGYMSAKSFADAAVELMTSSATSGTYPSGTEALYTRMEQLAAQARGDLTKVKAGLEAWFDDAMVAAADAYKRWTTVVVLLTGLVLTVLANASAIDVAKDLWTSSATRAAVVEAADATVEQGQSGACADKSGIEGVSCSVEQTSTLDLPLGWSDDRLWASDASGGETAGWWVSHVLGWVLTALLLMMGAPFWFDVLSRLTALRATSSKPASAAQDPGSATTQVAAAAASGTPPTPPTPPAPAPAPTMAGFTEVLALIQTPGPAPAPPAPSAPAPVPGASATGSAASGYLAMALGVETTTGPADTDDTPPGPTEP